MSELEKSEYNGPEAEQYNIQIQQQILKTEKLQEKQSKTLLNA